MNCEAVVLAVVPSEQYGREAKVTIECETILQARVCENALNEMVKSSWYNGDKNVVHIASFRNRVRETCTSMSVAFIE
ncbi:hypothetical protein QMI71_004660 [Salmonella enterica]|nr:hypothetical protein [Salmonella enterica]